MSNIQVTHDRDLNNARSESSLVINPNNPQQIVAGSKKFINYHTTTSPLRLRSPLMEAFIGTTLLRSRCCPAGPGSRTRLSRGTIPVMCFLWGSHSTTLPALPSSALPCTNPQTGARRGALLTSSIPAPATISNGRPGTVIRRAPSMEGFMPLGMGLAGCASHAPWTMESHGLE